MHPGRQTVDSDAGIGRGPGAFGSRGRDVGMQADRGGSGAADLRPCCVNTGKTQEKMGAPPLPGEQPGAEDPTDQFLSRTGPR